MRRHGTTIAERSATFSTGNVEAAQHILANVERYGGLDAGLVGWARRIVATTAADEKLAPATGQPRLPGLEIKQHDRNGSAHEAR
jgi:tRNA C32,U32 (ribose-2'-O)-methylase TrmJ